MCTHIITHDHSYVTHSHSCIHTSSLMYTHIITSCAHIITHVYTFPLMYTHTITHVYIHHHSCFLHHHSKYIRHHSMYIHQHMHTLSLMNTQHTTHNTQHTTHNTHTPQVVSASSVQAHPWILPFHSTTMHCVVLALISIITTCSLLDSTVILGSYLRTSF